MLHPRDRDLILMAEFTLRRFDSAASSRQTFLVVLAVTFGLRLALAAILPITGDEAYFLSWGQYPAWGFYDHPPMVGWWLAALAALSQHMVVLRAPALLVPVVLACAVVATMRRQDERLAWATGTMVLLVPLNAWNVAITTDIPLMFFAGFTVLMYLRALRTGHWSDFLFTGLLLGGALLSKYFAGMLALGIAAHALWRPSPRKLRGLALVIIGSLPGAAIQIAWNWQNCWPNVMFNLVNRNEDAGWSWRHPLLYVVALAYAVSPPLLMEMARATRAWFGTKGTGASVAGDGSRAALVWLFGVPFALFAALTMGKTIGLHWLASFVVPVVLWFALRGAGFDRRMAGALKFLGWFALAHYLLITTLLVLPIETFRSWKSYPSLVMTVHGPELAQALSGYGPEVTFASNGYSAAVTMSYSVGRRVIVFGPGSSHARHDDILTDFTALAGRDIVIVRKDNFKPGEYEPYFERVTYRSVTLRGARFDLVEGHGLRYEVYRDAVLDQVRQRYYQLPRWLPRGQCYFCDRYFPDRSCHR